MYSQASWFSRPHMMEFVVDNLNVGDTSTMLVLRDSDGLYRYQTVHPSLLSVPSHSNSYDHTVVVLDTHGVFYCGPTLWDYYEIPIPHLALTPSSPSVLTRVAHLLTLATITCMNLEI